MKKVRVQIEDLDQTVRRVAGEQAPRYLQMARKALADDLRLEADSEGDPRVARKLKQIADCYECGQRVPGTEDFK